MDSLFDQPKNNRKQESPSPDAPLAERIRPKNFAEYIGQDHLLNHGSLLRRAIESDCFTSIILTGPPGIGKTSLAEIIATQSKANFIALSAIASTVQDVRQAIKEADENRKFYNQKTILFIDELHRFNKAQQDSLLKDIEKGTIRFIGATTHNPQFYIIPPLVSRSHLFHLENLNEEQIHQLIDRALEHPEAFPNKKVSITQEAKDFLSSICEGDARKTIGALELAVATSEGDEIELDLSIMENCVQKKALNYDDDAHYDTISAFIKSMRGSDPDAAVYWLAKMLHAGEDIRFIARRLMIFASEDIGNADPQALQTCVSASQAVEIVGMPEARIILSQATTYCATAPKSNAAYKAINEALSDVQKSRVEAVPMYLRDSHTSGYNPEGKKYDYPHNSEEGFVKQDYIGVDKNYYEPVNRGYEQKIRTRMDYWQELRAGSADVPSASGDAKH